MKRKLIFSIILSSILFSSACSPRYFQGSEAVVLPSPTLFATEFIATSMPSATPLPKELESADVEFASTSIDDDIVTIDLPTSFTQYETGNINDIYSSAGYAGDMQDGNYYTFSVLRFYQQEDPNTSITNLLEYDESMETYQYGSQIDYKNIMSNMSFGDGIGHISKITIGLVEKYTATLNVGEIYYRFTLNATGTKAADELALRIITSIYLDGTKAKTKSDVFTVNWTNNIYYSSKLADVSIPCHGGWFPAESMHFSLSNSILSLMTADKQGTVTVRYYPKVQFAEIASYADFKNYMTNDLLNRGFVTEDEFGSIQTLQDENERAFTVYPSDIVITHFYIEYSDAYYCIEMMYSGADAKVVGQMLNMGQEFIDPGAEIEH